jgi:hypothetical protein
MTLIGDFNKAGWMSFVSHLVDVYNPHHTRCGLSIEGLRGNYEVVDAPEPTCKNCLRSLQASIDFAKKLEAHQ